MDAKASVSLLAPDLTSCCDEDNTPVAGNHADTGSGVLGGRWKHIKLCHGVCLLSTHTKNRMLREASTTLTCRLV